MIVTCERCEQRYKIRADKLPPQGGKIRCPTCRHVFIVRPGQEGAEAEPEKTPAPTVEEPGQSAPPEDTATAESSDEGGEEKSWKLQVAGLPYAFQTLESLRAWLLVRDGVDNIKVAREGDDWKELGDYPGLLTKELMLKFFPLGDVPTTGEQGAPVEETKASKGSANTSQKLSANNTDLPPPTVNPPSPGAESREARKTRAKMLAAKKNPQPQRKAARNTRSKPKPPMMTGRAKGLLGLAVLLLAAGAVLQLTGAINLLGLIPGATPPLDEAPRPGEGVQVTQAETKEDEGSSKPKIEFVEKKEDDPDFKPEEVVKEPTEEEKIAAQIAKGVELVEAKKWPQARAYLEPLLEKQPANVDLLEALIKVYKGLNLKDEVDKTKEKLEEAKAKAEEAKAAEGSAEAKADAAEASDEKAAEGE